MRNDHSPNQAPAHLVITNVRLACRDRDVASKRWNLVCHDGRVSEITLYHHEDIEQMRDRDPSSGRIDADGSLMLPSLCHSHIHLDKCFILEKCGNLMKGTLRDFNEAMEVTREAKSRFPLDIEDLHQRGARVIRESVENGVTAMRAHVEVDTTVNFACLDVALKLQHTYETMCDIQIAAFAQEPLFSAPGDTTPGLNFYLLQEAALRERVTVVGSAPYVEPSIEQAKLNIALIFEIAASKSVDHIDFHLDYNLDLTYEPLIYEVVSQARKYFGRHPPDAGNRLHITVGHATRLQLFTPSEWRSLVDSIDGLPITFIGLPQSDMYMLGRSEEDSSLGPPRSTLRVPYIARKYGVKIAMSVNNVENAFTPQGSLDPLSLCTFGAAIFQAVTAEDIRTLAQSVTLTSKVAIGQQMVASDLEPEIGDPADFVIIHGRETLHSVVMNPSFDGTTIRAGVVVATRKSKTWLLGVV